MELWAPSLCVSASLLLWALLSWLLGALVQALLKPEPSSRVGLDREPRHRCLPVYSSRFSALRGLAQSHRMGGQGFGVEVLWLIIISHVTANQALNLRRPWCCYKFAGWDSSIQEFFQISITTTSMICHCWGISKNSLHQPAGINSL